MSEPARRPFLRSGVRGATPRLESWKEIAAYLGRSVRTVQRWEARAELPVYRVQPGVGSVYAHDYELDAWWDDHGARLAHQEQPPPASPRPGRSRWRTIALGALVSAGLGLLSPIALRFARPSGGVLPRAVDPGVREAYLKGRLFLENPTEEETRKAIDSFEQAVRKDPSHAPAYAGLARAHLASANMLVRPRLAIPAAKAAAQKALALDSSLPEAYTSRGLLRAAFEWDLPASESDFRHALEIDPGDARARLYLGLVLIVQGRRTEGLAEVERAQQDDPLSMRINARLGMTYAFLGKHDLAQRQCRKTLELNKNSPEGHGCLAYALERMGAYDEAITAYERANDLGYRALPHIARVQSLAGREGEARRRLRRLEEEWRQGKAWSPYDIAKVWEALGEHDEAFAWLERAYEEHDNTLVSLPADPEWEALRSHPRFVALARKAGLIR